MSFPTPGYITQVAWATETSYSVIPTSTAYNLLGAVQRAQDTINQNPIVVYRLDGVNRFPQAILQGRREPDLEIEYWPYDIALLTNAINNISSTSQTFVVMNPSAGNLTYDGCRAARISFRGTPGEALTVTLSLQAAGVTATIPAGATFTPLPLGNPMYFVDQQVSVGGTVTIRPLEWSVDIDQGLRRVFQFGTPEARAIVPLAGEIRGSITYTFQDMTEYNQMMALSPNNIVFTLGKDVSGVSRTLTIFSARFVEFRKPQTPRDLITLEVPFIGQGVSIA